MDALRQRWWRLYYSRRLRHLNLEDESSLPEWQRYPAIEDACAQGNLQRVRDLVEDRHVDLKLDLLNQPQPMEGLHEALWIAIENGHPSIVSYLMSQGVEITMAAVNLGLESGSIPICETLIAHGLDINAPAINLWVEFGPPLLTYEGFWD